MDPIVKAVLANAALPAISGIVSGLFGKRRKQQTAAEKIAEQQAQVYAYLSQLGKQLLNPQGQEPLVGQYGALLQKAIQSLTSPDYTLGTTEQQYLNQVVSQFERTGRAAEANAVQALRRRGITGGPLYDATMQALRTQLAEAALGQATELTMKLGQQRNQNLLGGLQAMGGAIGTGAGLMSGSAAGMTNPAQIQAGLAGQAAAGRQQDYTNLVGLLGALKGGFFDKESKTGTQPFVPGYPKSTPPFMPSSTNQWPLKPPPLTLGGYKSPFSVPYAMDW